MDSFARSLVAAGRVLNSKAYRSMRKERYSSFDSGDGAAFERGSLKLEDLRDIALKNGTVVPKSGRQELYESLINRCL
jgi:xylose isomerase